MRVISNLRQHDAVGIILSPAKEGDDFEVRIGDLGVLARVEREHLDEMVRVGHAFVVPTFTFIHDCAMAGTSKYEKGGSTIYRCDAEVRGGEVWLVPEKEESKRVLCFYKWSAWMNEGLKMEIDKGTTELARIDHERWKDYFHVFVLEPGSWCNFSRPGREEIPGTDRTCIGTRREPKYREVTRQWRGVQLTEDGSAIDF